VEYHNEQIKIYKQQVQDIRELGSRVNLLKTRLSLVKELLEERTTWSDRLTELFYYLPPNGIWIEGLTINREKLKQNTVGPKPNEEEIEQIVAQISGNAVSVDRVSEFIGNLEESKTFGNIVFDSASADSPKASNSSFMSFRFRVQVLKGSSE
jgi:Tfp pilus assembly protein PilN